MSIYEMAPDKLHFIGPNKAIRKAWLQSYYAMGQRSSICRILQVAAFNEIRVKVDAVLPGAQRATTSPSQRSEAE